MTPRPRTLRVAAIQLECENGAIEANLERARLRIEDAVARGAELVLLPEFLAAGYVYEERLWDAAEPRDGPTARWLAEQSRRSRVYLGTTFLEADGEDFFNTFVLTDPEGRECGRVRKQTPAFFEAYFTRGEAGSHVIETALGRIGVGICYENHLAFMPRLLHACGVDLVLMPHSAPMPESHIGVAHLVTFYADMLRTIAQRDARALGVPVVFANKSGPWHTRLPGIPWVELRASFPGLSTIADSDGMVRAQLGSDPGVLVADVSLDPANKRAKPPQTFGRWARRAPWTANLMRLTEVAGRISYRWNPERKRRARAISAVTPARTSDRP